MRNRILLHYAYADSEYLDLGVNWTAKSSRAARRDADLAKRRAAYDRKVAQRTLRDDEDRRLAQGLLSSRGQ